MDGRTEERGTSGKQKGRFFFSILISIGSSPCQTSVGWGGGGHENSQGNLTMNGGDEVSRTQQKISHYTEK